METNKLYYSIGEVANLFGVNPSLIRFWEKEFDCIKPGKNQKGNRLYTQKDISYIKLIYSLVKERGYTLQGAKLAIKQDLSSLEKNMQAINTLNNIKKFLLNLKEELDSKGI